MLRELDAAGAETCGLGAAPRGAERAGRRRGRTGAMLGPPEDHECSAVLTQRRAQGVPVFERRLLACEVDARDLTSCRLLAAFERHGGALVPVAFLAFDDTVELVHTAPTHRRRGIASGLLALARDQVPALAYSPDHTAQGAAWARARGLDVPEVDTVTADVEVAWLASSVYLFLTHAEPDELMGLRPLRLSRRGLRRTGRRGAAAGRDPPATPAARGGGRPR